MNQSMSPNMMLIAQIEAERRKAGVRSYGQMVNDNDYSHLNTLPKPKKATCKHCGKEFEVPGKAMRTVCDDCKKEQRRKAMKKWWEKNGKSYRCRVCGKEVTRTRANEKHICSECRSEG